MGTCPKRSETKNNESVVPKINSVQEKCTTMDSLADDVLLLILDKLDVSDRNSLSQVCKELRRVEGLHRSTLRLPNYRDDIHMPNFLKRFPNLRKFGSPAAIPNSIIQLLPDTCSRLKALSLRYEDKKEDVPDFDDAGFFNFLEKGCSGLESIKLLGRNGVGDLGVISLVVSCRNLRNLDLGRCRKVSDLGLELIGGLRYLEALNLRECFLITDVGLGFLTMGYLCKTVKVLGLSYCSGITDGGLVYYLKKMRCLNELHLAGRGWDIMMGFPEMPSLTILNVSYSLNLCDEGLNALAYNCRNLRVLLLMGCEKVSQTGLLAFCGRMSLTHIYLRHCKINGIDIIRLVLECPSLRYIVISQGLGIPEFVWRNLWWRGCELNEV